MGFIDPEELEALATRIDGRAEDVREHARTFRGRVRDVAWESSGAQHYRDRCTALATACDGDADDLDDAADLLRKHAQEVRERIAALKKAEEIAKKVGEEVVDGVEDAGHAVVGGAKKVFHKVFG